MTQMIRLKSVTINKYKSIETEQTFEVEPDVTVLVGKNESGKTAILEAISKSNSYRNERLDAKFDFPRKEKKRYDKAGADVTSIRCTYCLTEASRAEIQAAMGDSTLISCEVFHTTSYQNPNGDFDPLSLCSERFFNFKFQEHDIRDSNFKQKVLSARQVRDIELLVSRSKKGKIARFLTDVRGILHSGEDIDASLSSYVLKNWIEPHLPKFLYYDEYYALPSKVKIPDIRSASSSEKTLETAKALFELADINIDQLLQDNDYEGYKSELEATGVDITLKLFKYWTTNTNLRVDFDIDRQRDDYGNDVPILMIRVFSNKYLMSLPLGSRSKGFNWFFSFLVWFSKIQVDSSSSYILLLDEPGLNLHASAQADLLHFIQDLAAEYQVIYTTHSPFMVESDKLHKVRTVLETETGTRISNSVQEKDPDTLFPLQAALGYDIAQNLFVAKNNLLVEGVSDLAYLQSVSSILGTTGREPLREDITIVPVGGLSKVATFISLLRGQQLYLACLLDSFTNQKGKQRVDDLVRDKIIREKNIRFFDEFTDSDSRYAEIEDLFEPQEYLKLYNQAFNLQDDLEIAALDNHENRIVKRIQKHIGKRYNHHRPAEYLAGLGADSDDFSDATLDRFENMFTAINKLFPLDD